MIINIGIIKKDFITLLCNYLINVTRYTIWTVRNIQKHESRSVNLQNFEEFYLTFWDLLGDDLVEVLNASFDAGLLPFSQRGALITLIHKKGHRLLHKNWRPISLLNIDYKICARALAGRLLKVLQFVIHPIRRTVLEADTFWGSIFLKV